MCCPLFRKRPRLRPLAKASRCGLSVRMPSKRVDWRACWRRPATPRSRCLMPQWRWPKPLLPRPTRCCSTRNSATAADLSWPADSRHWRTPARPPLFLLPSQDKAITSCKPWRQAVQIACTRPSSPMSCWHAWPCTWPVPASGARRAMRWTLLATPRSRCARTMAN